MRPIIRARKIANASIKAVAPDYLPERRVGRRTHHHRIGRIDGNPGQNRGDKAVGILKDHRHKRQGRKNQQHHRPHIGLRILQRI